MDRGAWRATVHGVAKSWTRLSDFNLYIYIYIYIYNTKSLCCTVVLGFHEGWARGPPTETKTCGDSSPSQSSTSAILYPWIQSTVDHDICFYWKNLCVSGPARFKLMLFKGQLHTLNIMSIISSVHGIFKARVLEWVAISFSNVSIKQGKNTCLLRWKNKLKQLLISLLSAESKRPKSKSSSNLQKGCVYIISWFLIFAH